MYKGKLEYCIKKDNVANVHFTYDNPRKKRVRDRSKRKNDEETEE